MSRTLALYWHTLRYLKPGQVAWRLWHGVRRRTGLYRIPQTPDPVPALDREVLRRLSTFLRCCNDAGIHGGSDLEALRNQSFTFLQQNSGNTGAIPWSDLDFPKLWRYQLHGFTPGRDFAVNAVNDDFLGDRDRALNWMRDWMRENPPGTGIAWDAWPVSERLMNWTLMLAAFNLHEEDVRASYARQARWLVHWLEFDLRANHLLKNACALTLAGLVLRDEGLERRGMGLLEAQLDEQILADGGHFERSPMYHAHALWDGLVVLAACEKKPAFLSEALGRMRQFLERLCHPDGTLPLFGDSVLNEGPPTQAMLSVARELLPRREAADPCPGTDGSTGYGLPDSGYYILGDLASGNRMIVKTSPPSPPYQPGHSHADLLSYELFLGGRPVIVDSGVHGYAESEFRAYCRSTRAHNTLQVDDLEQSEAWSVFRIARRPEALPPTFRIDDESAVLEAGYQHFSGYRHERSITYERQAKRWLILDRVLCGPGEHTVRSRIHFHPDCQLEAEGRQVIVRVKGATVIISLLSDGAFELSGPPSSREPSFYCPEFGRALAASTATVVYAGTPPILLRYQITAPPEASV